MGFQLTPRSMTLNCCKVKFPWNFATFLVYWIGLSSVLVLLPRQHSIGYMGDGFYRSKDPTNSIDVHTVGTYSTQTNQTYNKQT